LCCEFQLVAEEQRSLINLAFVLLIVYFTKLVYMDN